MMSDDVRFKVLGRTGAFVTIEVATRIRKDTVAALLAWRV
jgi:hypothetical protein